MRLLLLISLIFIVSSCGLLEIVLTEELGDRSVYELKLNYRQWQALLGFATKVEGTVINPTNDTICDVELKMIITENDEFVRKGIISLKQINPHDTCYFYRKVETEMGEDLKIEMRSSRYRTPHD
jgi:hypothetical protein